MPARKHLQRNRPNSAGALGCPCPHVNCPLRHSRHAPKSTATSVAQAANSAGISTSCCRGNLRNVSASGAAKCAGCWRASNSLTPVSCCAMTHAQQAAAVRTATATQLMRREDSRDKITEPYFTIAYVGAPKQSEPTKPASVRLVRDPGQREPIRNKRVYHRKSGCSRDAALKSVNKQRSSIATAYHPPCYAKKSGDTYPFGPSTIDEYFPRPESRATNRLRNTRVWRMCGRSSCWLRRFEEYPGLAEPSAHACLSKFRNGGC